MYDELIKNLRNCSEINSLSRYKRDLMKQAADAIEELSAINQRQLLEIAVLMTKPRWIPVTERLPEEWRPVLGLIQFCGEKEPPAQQVLWYLGNGHWRETWRGDMIESAVTHWMPLPEPPEGGEA